MARPRKDPISADLLLTRRHACSRMYFELGPARSIAKLAPLVRQRFGGPQLRTLFTWSKEDNWVAGAALYDAKRVEVLLREATAPADASDIDEIAALQQIARLQIKKIQSGVLAVREVKDALAVVEASLRIVADLTSRPQRRTGGSSTHIERAMVVPGGRAAEALAALERRARVVDAAAVAPAVEPRLPSPALAPPTEETIAAEPATPGQQEQRLILGVCL